MRRLLLLLSVFTMIVAACATQSFDVDLETPQASPAPTGFGYGTGIDGDLDVTLASSPMSVNTCHELVSGVGTSLTFGNTAGFDPGEILLVLQVRDDTNTPPDRAGAFEMVRLQSVGATDAVTTAPLERQYESVGVVTRAQACTVPEYRNLRVGTDAALLSSVWSGNAGGVLAFLVSSSLEMSATGRISSNGRGFGRGACNGNAAMTLTTDLNASQGGGKGEGVAGEGGFGAGNRANGGGGGNPLQAGGGGGGAHGAGGRGGYSQLDSTTSAFGRGGAAILLEPASPRLFFGGGGGGGHANPVETSACEGGSGGGIVFFQARIARGSGLIRSDGRPVQALPNTTGAGGGGGAGGTVWAVVATNGGFAPEVGVQGGKGGDTTLNAAPNTTAGPGGGGGGGYAHVAGFTPAGGVELDGGAAGDASGATDDTRGALEGEPGTSF